MDIKIEQKRGLRQKHYMYILVGLLVIFVGWKLIEAGNTNTFRTEKAKLTITPVIAGKFNDYVSITGIVSPIATIYMDAYEGGRVLEKLIEEGTMVKKGDIILKLENRSLYEQILSSENNLALKQNDLRTTRINFDSRQIEGKKELAQSNFELIQNKRAYEQNKTLFEEELIAKEEYMKAKENYELSVKKNEIIQLQTEQDKKLRNTTLRELDADLERMRKTLSMVYERIDQLNVRATANGQLGFLDAEIGQNISQGQRIGQINVLDDFKIEAEIDEHYIDRVKRELSATLERNNATYTLRLRKVYPEVRNGRFKVDLVFTDTKPETIRAGQSYSIKLQLGASSDALLLPKGGFYQSSGGQYVFVVNEDQKTAYKRNVQIGKQNARYFEIVGGLSAGESVITSSYNGFGNAEKIILKE